MSILNLWKALLECTQSDDTIYNALYDETSLSKSSIEDTASDLLKTFFRDEPINLQPKVTSLSDG